MEYVLMMNEHRWMNIDYKNRMSSCIAGLWEVGFLCTCAKNPDCSRFSQSSLEQVQPNNESSSNYPHRHNQKWPSEVACPVTVMWNRLWKCLNLENNQDPVSVGREGPWSHSSSGFPCAVASNITGLAWNRSCLLAFQKRWFKMWI